MFEKLLYTLTIVCNVFERQLRIELKGEIETEIDRYLLPASLFPKLGQARAESILGQEAGTSPWSPTWMQGPRTWVTVKMKLSVDSVTNITMTY